MTCSLATFHLSDGAQVATSDAVSTLPASNVFLRMPFDRWRTPSTSGHFVVQMASSLSVGQIVVMYTNATTAATIRVRAGGTVAGTVSSPSFDSGVLDHQPGTRDFSTWARTHFLLDLQTNHSAVYWRIDVNQVSGASFYESGRVGFLNPWRPSRGIDWGDRIVPVDTSLKRRSRNGTGHTVRGGLYREVELGLASTSEAEFLATAGDLRRRIEAQVPFVYAKRPRALSLGTSAVGGIQMWTDPDVMDHLIYAYLQEPFYPLNTRHVRRMDIRMEEVAYP